MQLFFEAQSQCRESGFRPAVRYNPFGGLMQALWCLFQPKGISTAIRAISVKPVDKAHRFILSLRD